MSPSSSASSWPQNLFPDTHHTLWLSHVLNGIAKAILLWMHLLNEMLRYSSVGERWSFQSKVRRLHISATLDQLWRITFVWFSSCALSETKTSAIKRNGCKKLKILYIAAERTALKSGWCVVKVPYLIICLSSLRSHSSNSHLAALNCWNIHKIMLLKMVRLCAQRALGFLFGVWSSEQLECNVFCDNILHYPSIRYSSVMSQ